MPQKGYDTKTNRLTDCQSQCDFDFDFEKNLNPLLGIQPRFICHSAHSLVAVLSYPGYRKDISGAN
jgi:hypothetical protein